MILTSAVILTVGAILFTLLVRAKDLPEPEAVSPTQYLEEKKATIYENLRDLQFEFRVGKLSEADYQETKAGLQRELAGVMAEIDRILTQTGASSGKPRAAAAKATAAAPAPAPGTVCPHCSARFSQPLKFCGECGKPMEEAKA